MSEQDLESFLENYKRIIEMKSDMCEGLKASRIAEMYVAHGKPGDSLEYFERALNELKPLIDDIIWGDIYFSTAGQYASTLDALGDLVSAERIFTHILQLRPDHFVIGDFAIFLHRRKRDFDAAERMYLSALSFYPKHASIHLKYAGFLRYVRGDLEKANQHYRLSYESNPEYPDGVGGYASFLHGTGGDKKLAESLYEKAIQTDNCHVNNLCNFGLFLSEELRNYERAEEIYRRALEVTPTHANSLYNYGVLLDSHCQRKSEAESLYCRCLEVEPKHSFALYNLAVLREEVLSSVNVPPLTAEGQEAAIAPLVPKYSPQEVRSLYERAVAADPKDATTMADCGRFISDKMNDPINGEPYLKRSLQLDPACDVAALHLGLINLKHKRNIPEAISFFRSVLGRKSRHPHAMHQLARALIELHQLELQTAKNFMTAAPNTSGSRSGSRSPRKGSNLAAQLIATTNASNNSSISPLDEAIQLFEIAAEVAKEPPVVLFDYIAAVEQHGNPRHKLRAIVFVEAALSRFNITNMPSIEHMVEKLKM